MTTKKKKPSRLAKALVETARGMHKAGLLDRTTYDKITMRHLDATSLPKAAPLTAEQIRTMRERARMSQAVFARHLNLTVGYVSQLERGAKQPSGAALALLNVIKRKGIEAIL
jgi:putative transcriptional regulator